MILTIIITLFYWIVSLLIGFLPSATPLPVQISSAFTTIVGYINAYTFLINVSALLTALGLVLVVELVFLSAHLSVWIIHLIRGK